ncbi:MAG TPA: FixH family protein [Bryobacteraceae bacterium]|nr:FixH family protein [Bryobacteraceae bacterium]
MRFFALLFCTVGLLLAQQQEANFTIRFEPNVILEANAQIPFAIHVTDDRHKPVQNATVTLQIETPQDTKVQVFKATFTADGVYIAKPVFPSSGHWKLYVEVHQGNLMSARTIEFYVPESATS